jgi:hypothetical protein
MREPSGSAPDTMSSRIRKATLRLTAVILIKNSQMFEKKQAPYAWFDQIWVYPHWTSGIASGAPPFGGCRTAAAVKESD